MVLISDGRGRGKPARLELTKDALAVQVPIGMDDSFDSQNTRDFELGIRMVTLKRNRDGGLGIAVKVSKVPTPKLHLLLPTAFVIA